MADDLFENKTDTLKAASMKYAAELREGTTCPCCNRFGKIYKRKFNFSMARCLVALYKSDSKDKGKWINIVHDLTYAERGGDYGKLVYWGFIVEHGGETDDGNSSGRFRITEAGRRFVEGATARRYVLMYNDREWPNDEDCGTIRIHDAIGDKFNLLELLHS